MKKIVLAALAMLTLVALPVRADITIQDPWVRGTTPAQRATGAFMEIISAVPAAVISATSPVAGIVEIHAMKTEDGIMKMRPLERLELPAGERVKLQPGGAHIMLMELREQLKPGASVPITLKVMGADGKARTVEISAPVRDLATPSRQRRLFE
jgi:periplasmic copper chaperone A